MDTRWIYTQQGQPAFYQTGDQIYSPEGKHSFWVSDGWWFRVPDGQASFYIGENNWVFAANGKPSYYYDEE